MTLTYFTARSNLVTYAFIWEKVKTVDFLETIEGQGHFFTIYFQVLYVFYFTRPRYQVSVYRTIGPLVFIYLLEVGTLYIITQ